ncbi:hypothetical protein JCM10207_004001 [Rhodosporidiobolus poonsookiae]
MLSRAARTTHRRPPLSRLSSHFLSPPPHSSPHPALAATLVLAGAALGGYAGTTLYTRGWAAGGGRGFWQRPLACEEAKVPAKDEENKDSSFLSKLPSLSLPSLPSAPSLPLPSLPNLPDISFPRVSTTLTSWTASFASLTASLTKLQEELTLGPGSTYALIVAEGKDPAVHPELQFDASVRLGTDLALSERAYLRNRREAMRGAFARLMDVPLEEVDVRDLPVVAVAASGGGYRAMLNTIASLEAAKETGVYDCVSFISGVSGSCWALNVLFSLGGGSIPWTLQHLRERVKEPFLAPETLAMLLDTDNEHARTILTSVVLKESSKGGEISLVDAYGTLVSTRLYVPSPSLPPPPQPLTVRTLKTSSQRSLLDLGAHPLPIYTSVRHDLPSPSEISASEAAGESRAELAARGSYTHFELTPYEVGSDALGAWIPTWALGRLFDAGRSTERVPELGLPVLSGIYASAFCATLFAYFREVQPMLARLPLFNRFNEFVTSNAHHLDSIHPFPPAELPNFLYRLPSWSLPPSIPESLTALPTLGVADAGMELNLPYVPLLRRQADVVIALDASADSQDRWFKRAEALAREYEARALGAGRGGEGGPAKEETASRWPRVDVESLFPSSPAAAEVEAGDAASKVDEAKSQELRAGGAGRAERAGIRERNPEPVPLGSAPESADKSAARTGTDEKGVPLPAVDAGGAEGKEKPMPRSEAREPPLSKCSIWLGSTHPDLSSTCRNDCPSLADVQERDGVALAYIPLRGDEQFSDPLEVFSTWRFDYEGEETDRLVRLAKDNFKAGEEHLKTVIKGVWLRKRQQRLDDEAKQRAVEQRGL